jgi:hypothetical protein
MKRPPVAAEQGLVDPLAFDQNTHGPPIPARLNVTQEPEQHDRAG